MSPRFLTPAMSFEDFEHLARLHVVGALDPEESREFEAGRTEFGDRAETCLHECLSLNAAFALSLRPRAPRGDAKERLMGLIRGSMSGF